jgi:hypothetical protein
MGEVGEGKLPRLQHSSVSIRGRGRAATLGCPEVVTDDAPKLEVEGVVLAEARDERALVHVRHEVRHARRGIGSVAE